MSSFGVKRKWRFRSLSDVIDADEPSWLIAMVVNPVKKLRDAVDLIVVSTVWELFHLGLKIAQPRCALWQENLSSFDLCCLSMEPGDLVLFRIDGDGTQATFEPQILNKTGAGALILNQDRVGAIKVRGIASGLEQRPAGNSRCS